MLTKTITYTDFDGNSRSETFFFNLTKAEVTEFNFTFKGGLEAYIKQITNPETKDEGAVVQLLKEIIARSYGVKSDDGKRFIKNKELTEEFLQSEAYSELFMEIASDEKAAQNFIKHVLPPVPENAAPPKVAMNH